MNIPTTIYLDGRRLSGSYELPLFGLLPNCSECGGQCSTTAHQPAFWRLHGMVVLLERIELNAGAGLPVRQAAWFTSGSRPFGPAISPHDIKRSEPRCNPTTNKEQTNPKTSPAGT